MNAKIFQDGIEALGPVPSDNVGHRHPQAEHTLKRIDYCESGTVGFYLDGASAVDRNQSGSLGADRQSVAFVMHALDSLQRTILERQERNVGKSERDQQTREVTTGETRTVTLYMDALFLDAKAYDSAILQMLRKSRDYVPPSYWTKP